MMALILAVAMQQAMPTAAFAVAVNVVRTSCVVASETGTVSWAANRRPGPDAVQCTRSSNESLPPPRIVASTQTVEGTRAVVIDY